MNSYYDRVCSGGLRAKNKSFSSSLDSSLDLFCNLLYSLSSFKSFWVTGDSISHVCSDRSSTPAFSFPTSPVSLRLFSVSILYFQASQWWIMRSVALHCASWISGNSKSLKIVKALQFLSQTLLLQWKTTQLWVCKNCVVWYIKLSSTYVRTILLRFFGFLEV